MSANVIDLTAAHEWTRAVSGATPGPEPECADMLRSGIGGMTELITELMRAARSQGLPPGSSIQIELALRGRRTTLE